MTFHPRERGSARPGLGRRDFLRASLLTTISAGSLGSLLAACGGASLVLVLSGLMLALMAYYLVSTHRASRQVS
jgi:hypothetical protein